MDAPLLRTKLYVPQPRPDLVSRPRLVERLNGSLSRAPGVTLISAPAGFGKTTLLSAWIRDAKPPVAWLSLDGGDNDPARFWTYVIAALRTRHPDLGEATLAALRAPQPPPIAVALTALLNELAALPGPVILVLDDFHLIEAQAIHDAVTSFLDHLPPPLHLMIATRADPPLPLARLRGRGQMTEIRAEDLRFTPAETAAFLTGVMGLDLPAGDVRALETRTEGWITALQLAALSLQGQDEAQRRGFIRTFTGSHRYILDYLAEEVLGGQPESLQVFLLQTAILERLTGPLCDALTGQTGGQATLERLEQANLFIVPLDDERRWYRYHRLFADLLRQRLQRAYGAQVPALHRQAAAWYESQGFVTEAMSHALAGADFERAARLVGQNAQAMLYRGEVTQLLAWLGALPDELVRSRPWLCICQAWALLLSGQLEAIEPYLHAAGQAPPPADAAEPGQDGPGHVAAIRAYAAALQGDAPRASELARQALDSLSEKNVMVRSVVTYLLGGVCLLTEDLAGAAQAFAEAGRIGQEAGNLHIAVPALCALAHLQAVRGQLHQAAGTFGEALQLAGGRRAGRGQPLPMAAMAFSGLAGLLYEWNDLEAATRHLTQGLEQGELWGNADTLASGYVGLARARQAQGDLDGALEALQRAEQLLREHAVTPTTEARVAASGPRLWLARGNRAAIESWVRQRGLEVAGRLSYVREVEYLALARVLLARNEAAEATALLGRLLQAAETAGRQGSAIEILALQALALRARDDIPGALAALERALSLAEPEGYARTFLDEGEPMLELLRHAGSRGIAPAYVSRLLAAAGPTAADRASPAAQPLIDPLSERELEVLQLLAAGLTNQEIARKLVVATGTVKAHTASIYLKLNAHSRSQAVALARELGLL